MVCTCPPGYVGNGQGSNGCVTQGVTDGPCASNPCRNGALCQVLYAIKEQRKIGKSIIEQINCNKIKTGTLCTNQLSSIFLHCKHTMSFAWKNATFLLKVFSINVFHSAKSKLSFIFLIWSLELRIYVHLCLSAGLRGEPVSDQYQRVCQQPVPERRHLHWPGQRIHVRVHEFLHRK